MKKAIFSLLVSFNGISFFHAQGTEQTHTDLTAAATID